MDEIDWSYLEPSRKLEMPSEGLPAETDTNRETPELETARVVHEMADTPIPEMSTRDTSSNLTLRNYITDIISQPGAVAGPDISNELLPEVQDVAFRFPVNETPLRESSSTTTRKPIQSIGPSSILNMTIQKAFPHSVAHPFVEAGIFRTAFRIMTMRILYLQ
jgi:hypothetical protein